MNELGRKKLFISFTVCNGALSHEHSFNEDCNKIIDNRLITV